MDMYENDANNIDRVVLCGASAYEKKFYLNDAFSALPENIQNELKIMCVLFTEEIGGVLTLEFREDGKLYFLVDAKEDDYFFDEIGSGLKIKKIQMEQEELLQSLELFYKVFYLGEDLALDDVQLTEE